MFSQPNEKKQNSQKNGIGFSFKFMSVSYLQKETNFLR